MPRKIKRQEAIDLIRSLDVLELQYQISLRETSDSKKREFKRDVSKLLESYLKDDRDVVVLAIKVK